VDLGIMTWNREVSDPSQLPDPVEGGARPARVSIRALEDRIRHYNSDLAPASETFRAAVILLAGVEYGHNIDLLARRTMYDRAFVARVARRLIDNGVWKSGVTVADWSSADEASGTFWNDVSVAEGKMCRRIGPDGRIEWAPAGFWNKNFQFVDPGADQRLATLYLDAQAAPAAETPAAVIEEAPVLTAEATAPAAAEPAPETPATVIEADAVTDIVGPVAEKPAANGAQPPQRPIPNLKEVFGDVVWIG
jgi:hypothetical protein